MVDSGWIGYSELAGQPADVNTGVHTRLKEIQDAWPRPFGPGGYEYFPARLLAPAGRRGVVASVRAVPLVQVSNGGADHPGRTSISGSSVLAQLGRGPVGGVDPASRGAPVGFAGITVRASVIENLFSAQYPEKCHMSCGNK